MEGLRPIDPRSIHQELQEHIKEYILVSKLQPGDPLPSETRLAKHLGVSRPVLREALRSLESLGVVRARQGGGRYVNEFNLDAIVQNLGYSMLFDMEDIHEILDVRERLESSFIADAISAMDPETLDQLRALVNRMRQKAAADQAFLEEDLAFHRAVYVVISNRLLIKLLDVFWDVYKNLSDESLHIVKDLDGEAQNHEAILEAIEAKDVALAQHHLIEHFHGIRDRLRATRLGSTGVASA